MLNRSISSAAYIWMLSAGVALCSVLATLLPHDPYIRYQTTKDTLFAYSQFIYERLHFDETPVDIAFIGSSRTLGGVYVPELELALQGRGLPMRVINMSLPASGMDLRLAEARELLRARPETKLIVISVSERLPRQGHQAMGDLATASDLLAGPYLSNVTLPQNLLNLPMRQINLATATALPDAFGYQEDFSTEAYLGSSPSPNSAPGWTPLIPDNPLTSQQHRDTLEAESQMRNRELGSALLPPDYAWLEFAVSRQSLDEIVRLAEANDTRVAFLFLPFYKGPSEPAELSWLSQRAPVWQFTQLGQDPCNYVDAAHLSTEAVPQLTEFLADAIESEFGLAMEPATMREAP